MTTQQVAHTPEYEIGQYSYWPKGSRDIWADRFVACKVRPSWDKPKAETGQCSSGQ